MTDWLVAQELEIAPPGAGRELARKAAARYQRRSRLGWAVHPSPEKVDAREALVGVEGIDIVGLGQGPADLQGEESHAPELAGQLPCVALAPDVLASLGGAPGAPIVVREPPVRGNLQVEEVDEESTSSSSSVSTMERLKKPLARRTMTVSMPRPRR